MTADPPAADRPAADPPAGEQLEPVDAAPPGGEPQRVEATPRRTRTSRAFVGLVAGAIVLVLLLIFILENTQSVKISFLGASGHVALGIALLLGAVGGALLTGALGAARIAQLRLHTKRYSRSVQQ
jgi:lipopolysaccharide assembly protein A